MNEINLILSIFIGVPKAVILTEAAFRATLFEGTPFNCEVNSFILNDEKQMTRIKMYKRGLSDSCTKVTVHPDKITTSCLVKNDKYI